MPAVILAFLVGVSVGYYLARARGEGREKQPAAAAAAPTPTFKPNKRGRKAGLTEADFQPSDDILEQLRRAAEGEIDPRDLHAHDTAAQATEAPPKPRAKPKAPKPTPPDPVTMTEAERRVFERLRRMEAGEEESSA